VARAQLTVAPSLQVVALTPLQSFRLITEYIGPDTVIHPERNYGNNSRA